MQSLEERLVEIEKEVAIMRELMIRDISVDEDFKKEIRDTLNTIKERNTKVDMFIESELQAKKDWADLCKGLKEKLATAGVLGIFSLLGYVIWYAVVQFIQNGGR